MARRKKTSLIEDLFTIASRLPWWASLAIALIAWFALHPIAIAELPKASAVGGISNLMTAQFFKSIASVGQYLLPITFGIGAAASLITRARRRNLFAETTSGPTSQKINELGWHEFEQLIGEWFRRQGYAVTETGGGGADGGIDLSLKKNNETYLVQCKHWRAQRVSVTIIRELYGVMAAQGAAGGFVVTSGSYTTDATEFAQGRNIELLDGKQLGQWLNKYQTERHLAEKSKEETERTAPNNQPLCPTCQSVMVRRTAKRGASAGQAFWGCSHFPTCRGIRPIGE